jgi:putative transposase
MERKLRKSLRLKDYDYSRAGAYFITMCTESRKPYFEKFPELQEILQTQWSELEATFPEIKLDEFVVMPNHIHGIIFIAGPNPVGTIHVGVIHELPLRNKSQLHRITNFTPEF